MALGQTQTTVAMSKIQTKNLSCEQNFKSLTIKIAVFCDV